MEINHFEKAENIREVIRYLQKFKNTTSVIYLDETIIESPLFSSHMRDIALLQEAGLKVVIIPGARTRIDDVLTSAKIEWNYIDNIRVTTQDAMPLIKLGLDLNGGVSITYKSATPNPTSEQMGDAVYKLQLKAQDYSTEAEVYQEGNNRINIEFLC